MIVSVICPVCGKKIQIDDSNDANICIICGKPFITEKAVRCDEEKAVSLNTDKSNNVNNNMADHYYNNIMGLYNQGKSRDEKAYRANIDSLKVNYPLDQRNDLVSYLVALEKYEEKDCNGNIPDLISSLGKIKENPEWNEKYYLPFIENLNKRIGHNVNGNMLNVKLYLETISIQRLENAEISYAKNYASYKVAEKKYKDDYSEYERKYQTYLREKDRYQSAVLNGDPLPLYPMAPYKPHYPSSPTFPSNLANEIKAIIPHLKENDFGLDTDYLVYKYRAFKNKEDIMEHLKTTYNELVLKIFNLLPKDIKDKLHQEDILRQEALKKAKEAKIIEEIKQFYRKYLQTFKSSGAKAAYKLLCNPITIGDKKVYTYHEVMKYKKSLFGVKYLDNIESFDLEKVASIAYKNMNFKL